MAQKSPRHSMHLRSQGFDLEKYTGSCEQEPLRRLKTTLEDEGLWENFESRCLMRTCGCQYVLYLLAGTWKFVRDYVLYDHDSRWQSDDDNADESMKLWKKTIDCSKSSNIWSSELQQHFKSDIYECSLKLAD